MVMLSQIDSAVCEKYGIPPTALKGDSRERRAARPRQVAMYLGRQLTSYSLPQIGLWYGDRDHTTVLHGVRRVQALMTESTLFAVEVADLCDQLGGQKGTRRSKLAVSCRRFVAEHMGAEITTDLEQTG